MRALAEVITGCVSCCQEAGLAADASCVSCDNAGYDRSEPNNCEFTKSVDKAPTSVGTRVNVPTPNTAPQVPANNNNNDDDDDDDDGMG